MSAATQNAPATRPAPGAPVANATPGTKKVVRRVIRRPDGTIVDAPPVANSNGAGADPKTVVRRVVTKATDPDNAEQKKATEVTQTSRQVVKKVVQPPGGPNTPVGAPGTDVKAIPPALQAGSASRSTVAPGLNAEQPMPGSSQTSREPPKAAPGVGQRSAPTNVNPSPQSIPPPKPVGPPKAAPGVGQRSAPTNVNPSPQSIPPPKPVGPPQSTGATSTKSVGTAVVNNPIASAVGAEVAVGVGKGINLMFDSWSKKIK